MYGKHCWAKLHTTAHPQSRGISACTCVRVHAHIHVHLCLHLHISIMLCSQVVRWLFISPMSRSLQHPTVLQASPNVLFFPVNGWRRQGYRSENQLLTIKSTGNSLNVPSSHSSLTYTTSNPHLLHHKVTCTLYANVHYKPHSLWQFSYSVVKYRLRNNFCGSGFKYAWTTVKEYFSNF